MATATNTTAGEIVLGGDLTGTADAPELVSTGVIPGTYSPVQRMYVDAKGRVVSIAKVPASEIADYVDVASTTNRGVVQIGNHINVSSAVISAPQVTSTDRGVYSLQSPMVVTAGEATVDVGLIADATTVSPGVVQIGSGLTMTGDVLSRSGLSDATTGAKGLVQVGTNFLVSSGLLSANVATTSAKGVFQTASPFVMTAGTLSIPNATTGVKGVVQVGSGFNVTSGVISLPLATTSSAGVFSFSSDFQNQSGTIALRNATTSATGLMRVGTNLSVSAGVVSLVSPPNAADFEPGLMQSGDYLTIADGVVSTNYPVASTTTAGLMKVGTGLSVTTGVVSVVPQDATTSSKGGVSISSPFTVSSGVINLQDATTGVKGVVSIDNTRYLAISGGVVSYTVPAATASVPGIVQIASNAGLAISGDGNGVLSSQNATASLKGIVKPGFGFAISGNQISLSVDATISAKGVIQADSTYFTLTSGLLAFKLAESNTGFGTVKSANTANIGITTGTVNVGSNVSKLGTFNTFTQAQVSSKQTDSYTATYAPDLSLSNLFEMTLTGNVSLANPTNGVAGGVYTIVFIQDGTGNRTLTLSGSGYKTNKTITLSTAAGARDVLTLIYKSSTEVFVLFVPGF